MKMRVHKMVVFSPKTAFLNQISKDMIRFKEGNIKVGQGKTNWHLGRNHFILYNKGIPMKRRQASFSCEIFLTVQVK